MIDAAAIERAEHVLQVVYGQRFERQLEVMNVDRDAFDNWISTRKEAVRRHYPEMWGSMDPRLEPAINTLLAHFFLTGIVAGKNAEREII